MTKLFPLLACAALAGCATVPGSISATNRVPAATVAAADTAYVVFEKSSEIAVRAGQMSLETFHKRTDDAYKLLLKVRAGQATLEALQAITGI